ncbi:hypothetical protein [Pedobacter nutrimenti]|uniref:hypothetical protein n=1 Tax=Pedobacter nutrimenti TaxID=1241337 RepID=UPI002931D3A1|nr:hypothetical protein [Pedobacter nutrimenti]
MKKTTLILLFFYSLSTFGQRTTKNKLQNIKQSAVPSLDELSSEWTEVNTLLNFPSVMNFVGGIKTSQNLTAFQDLTLPPYAQGGLSAELLLDGKRLNAEQSMWYPYQVRRKSSVDGVNLESTIRMPFERQGILLRFAISNDTKKTHTLNLSMNGTGRIRLYSPQEWRTWGNLRPTDSNFIASVSKEGKTLIISDKSSPAVSVYAFSRKPSALIANEDHGDIKWTITLAPGKNEVIEFAYAVGSNVETVASTAEKWVSNFKMEFDMAKSKWEERWQASFKPGNKHFSGNYPKLVTNDPKIRRVYYQGALVPLLLCRTNLPYSQRSFVTAGPEWANTLVYFWDTEMWANTWAMLEPKSMKEQLLKWFSTDHHKYYAVDYISGEGAGPWYAANDWSIFRCIEAYIDVTGDKSFLNSLSNGKTILQHLDDLATFYESRPLTKETLLANYGGPQNLLECSPSYVQGVPSLNAANVYMLRKTAKYYENSGKNGRAQELQSKAKALLPQVMSLYEPGQGVWKALDSTGNKVPIRHCYDYITIGQALENDLSSKQKSEMNNFVETELLTRTWMRAMSLKDPAAAKSDRPDHGPMGSYDAWPPMTMDVMCRFGDFDKAISFLRATEEVTRQGSWAQAHEFLGPDGRGYDPIIRVAHRGGQDANEGCGTAFAEVIIRSFFGFRPDLSKDKPVLLLPNTPRGFNGKLEHVSWRKKLYTIVSDIKGVHIIAE